MCWHPVFNSSYTKLCIVRVMIIYRCISINFYFNIVLCLVLSSSVTSIQPDFINKELSVPGISS